MKQLTVYKSLLPKFQQSIPIDNPKTGRITYLGQILKQLGFPTLRKDGRGAYTIHDIDGPACPPFSIICNGRKVQTDLTTMLLVLSPENEPAIQEELAKHGFQIQFLKEPKP